MHNLSFQQQIQALQTLACSNKIPANDRYLEVYPDLLAGTQSLLPLNAQRLVFAAHAVFGWMPTQLRVNTTQVPAALTAVTNLITKPTTLSTDDLVLLSSTFQTARGNSVVSASKLLHFLAPDHFPIWDRIVAKCWGLPPSGRSAPVNYLSLVTACRRFTADPGGQNACHTLRQRLAHAGYGYPMTDMRLFELMLFLKP